MNLHLTETRIPGCYELQARRLTDERGIFVKTYHREGFETLGLRTDWVEQYYSVSQPGVVRGLHLQLPPHDHAKLVYCIAGQVRDVALDVRRGSPTYGEHLCIELSAERANMLYLPSGLAHGFCTFDQPATLVYNVTSVYHPESDTGIRWDTANIDWPHKTPQLSDRDQSFPSLPTFQTPFKYQPKT
ncbi:MULTISPECIES: dTDP-4-dehydrorhamnose 3,5-epimerase [unclassified Thiocapsa]|uniref:dTDP-4-dehydrorhamnose 3,5-epimerase n=1 Tax=unclassified Thiocapsa TaxID=2641286 RepID=UPI0035AD7BBB